MDCILASRWAVKVAVERGQEGTEVWADGFFKRFAHDLFCVAEFLQLGKEFVQFVLRELDGVEGEVEVPAAPCNAVL